ncbi:MAG: methyltransferase domain-containing protein [Sphingobacteriales bacterium]|nr:methyltransferase domain-containing protein [Sphingobacteriales bacterium]
MQSSWFKYWFNSPYYHQLYVHRDDEEAAEFIDKLIGLLKPRPGNSMLDVACGKGRHSIQLAEKGFEVTGIDLSEESIAEALESESDTLHFYTHDMRLPFWINYFNYAFNFFTSFGYFDTLREHDDAMRTIAQSLKPNGVFVLDYLNVKYAESHLLPSAESTVGDTRFLISKWYDEAHFYKKIVVEDPLQPEPIVYTEKVAKFSLDDFNQMFARQGLVIEMVFGDYNFAAYDVNLSPRLLMIARKKEL